MSIIDLGSLTMEVFGIPFPMEVIGIEPPTLSFAIARWKVVVPIPMEIIGTEPRTFSVEVIGIEPTTFWMPFKRSSQLSYTPKSNDIIV